MCVSLCHKRQMLYFNHEDCLPVQCPFTVPMGRCTDCRHRRGDLCGLTRAALPAASGCCHFNVALYAGDTLPATPETIALLGQRPGESIETTLDAYDVYYEVSGTGVVSVPIDDLAIPDIYGQGTEPEEEFEPDNFVGRIDWADFGLDW